MGQSWGDPRQPHSLSLPRQGGPSAHPCGQGDGGQHPLPGARHTHRTALCSHLSRPHSRQCHRRSGAVPGRSPDRSVSPPSHRPAARALGWWDTLSAPGQPRGDPSTCWAPPTSLPGLLEGQGLLPTTCPGRCTLDTAGSRRAPPGAMPKPISLGILARVSSQQTWDSPCKPQFLKMMSSSASSAPNAGGCVREKMSCQQDARDGMS